MKRPGRPRLDPDDAESVQYSVRLSIKQFDQTQREAKEARLTMAEWIRRMLERGVLHDKTRQ
jgi:hypothetical protein